MKTSSFSFSSSISPQQKYDVFLSFHGRDTRKRFTDHLYAALQLRGIVTFKDDIDLNRGEDIKYGLPRAIEESRISLVVFSKNYAESEWCLEELVKMMECSKRSHPQHIVLPIFYDVKPSEVRAQKGSVEDSLAKHQDCGRNVEKWKETLHEFANLSGFVLEDLSGGHEAKNIQIIVKDVEEKLNHVSLSVVDRPVGMEPRLHHIIEMLNMGYDDTRIVAIWGIGGVGKTEIAKVVYNMFHSKFEGSSFIADIKAIADQPNGMVSLQKQILFDILKIENHNIGSVHQGTELIKRRIFCQKVLLVLDDVDHAKQLEELAIDRNFLCHGSKIIITTRDISSVNSLEVDVVYEPEELDECQSIELFSWHAFKKDRPTEDYMELSNEVVSYLKGNPLAIEVIGSLLFKKTKSIWRSAITELKTIPNKEVQEKLKISFNSLSDERKELFLDIACFFVGKNYDFTIEILKECNFHPEIGIQELLERCLLKCQSKEIIMHDLLRDMGREIVRKESTKEPGKRSRLWHYKDTLRVLTEGTGTEKVEGLFLDFPEAKDIQANEKAFEKMVRLRLLHLNYVQLTVGYEHIISRRLVLLCWKGFPLDRMPSNLHMENLVYLDLSYSSLKYVWTGTKILDKLKFLHLNHCSSLIKTPDFSGLSNLVELSLNDCTSLVEVGESISCLNKIAVLDMKNCKKLKKLPFGIWMMKSLECLNLSGCSNLRNFARFKGTPSISWYSYMKDLVVHHSSYNSPKHVLDGTEILNKLKILCLTGCSSLVETPNFFALGNLEILLIDGCKSLEVIDESISCLNKLVVLRIRNCEKLRTLPFGIWMLKSLKELDLSYCSNLRNFAAFKGSPSTLLYSLFSSWVSTRTVGSVDLQVAKCSLKSLCMVGCNLSYIPSEIGCLKSLEELDISQNNFSTLPNSMGDLPQLRCLDVHGSRRLQSLPNLPPSLLVMFAQKCTSLESISMESNLKNAKGPNLVCYGCPKLVGSNLADSYNKGLLQYKGISAIRGCFDIFLTGGKVPNWFKYRSTGTYISFVASNKILGLIICTTFTLPDWLKERYDLGRLVYCFQSGVECCDCGEPSHEYPSGNLIYVIQKNSNGCERVYDPYNRLDPIAAKNFSLGAPTMIHNSNMMWFSFLPLSAIKMQVECRDEVKISLTACWPFEAIERGIALIHEDEGEEEEEDEDEEGEEVGIIVHQRWAKLLTYAWIFLFLTFFLYIYIYIYILKM